MLHRHGSDGQYKSSHTTIRTWWTTDPAKVHRIEGDISRSYYYKGEQFVESDHHSLGPYTDCEGNDV